MSRPVSATTRQYEEKLCTMDVGDSFFVPAVKQPDMTFLRRIAKKIGVHLEMVEFDGARRQDEIYQGQPGVRVWRREPL